MSEITARIRERGYWEVAIHPTSFQERRIPNLTDLRPILERCVVSVRGWDFPHISRHDEVVTQLGFIEQESEWQHTAERWRFYQSGLFVTLRAMPYDWRDRSTLWRPDLQWKQGSILGIGESLYDLFEFFEFAARLSNTLAGDDRMSVNIKAGGLKGRMLVVDDPMRFGLPRQEYTSAVDVVPLEYQYPRAELMADPASLAVKAARELFALFNRDISTERLSGWLESLRTRR